MPTSACAHTEVQAQRTCDMRTSSKGHCQLDLIKETKRIRMTNTMWRRRLLGKISALPLPTPKIPHSPRWDRRNHPHWERSSAESAPARACPPPSEIPPSGWHITNMNFHRSQSSTTPFLTPPSHALTGVLGVQFSNELLSVKKGIRAEAHV